MFSVPKDEVRWIGSTDFEADLEGIVPELKDWVDARCDTRTDVEKAAWAALKNKSSAQMTAAERSISDMLVKKMSELDECGSKAPRAAFVDVLPGRAWVPSIGHYEAKAFGHAEAPSGPVRTQPMARERLVPLGLPLARPRGSGRVSPCLRVHARSSSPLEK
jgi:hypothetical protein